MLARPNDVGDLIRSGFQFVKLAEMTTRLNNSKNGVIDRNGHIQTLSRPAGYRVDHQRVKYPKVSVCLFNACAAREINSNSQSMYGWRVGRRNVVYALVLRLCQNRKL